MSENNDALLPDENNDLIELVDESGETTLFELLGSFPFNDSHYLAVTPPTGEDDPESMEVFILKVIQDADGNDTYVTPDDAESDAAFNHFLTLVDAEEEEE